jgi:hypothetical protein
MRCVVAFATAFVLAALSGCVTFPDVVARDLRDAADGERAPFAAGAASAVAPALFEAKRDDVDARRLPLADGQIIVSESGGAMSLFFSLFARDDVPWVHAGIVAIEGDEPVVYEANGTFFPVPGLAPTATIRGVVRRVSVAEFLLGKRIVGLFALPPEADRERFVAFAREQHRRGTPFDPYFDTDDAQALYCTELVALALAAAGAPPVEATPVREHPSLAIAREWLGMRSARIYLAGRLVDPRWLIGRWSADLTDPQIDAYFAAKSELHRRFDAQVRLGHVFAWSASGMRLRPSVRQFFDAALAAGADATLAASDVARRVQALAHDRFDAALAAATTEIAPVPP